MESKKGMYIGIDAGGTHTDAVAVHEGILCASAKIPTQHDNLPASVHAALELLQEKLRAQHISLHHAQRVTVGTTLGINALVQNALPPVGLFLTAGPGIHPLNAALGKYVMLVEGSLDHRGQEVVPLHLKTVIHTAQQWYAEGVRHFAVVGKFSPRNSTHETAIATTIKEAMPSDIYITQGHDISGLLNFPRRVASTWLNAAVRDILCNFLDAVEKTLRDMNIHAPLFLLKANGGSMPAHEARHSPVESLLSGPAASAMGLMASGLLTPPSSTMQDAHATSGVRTIPDDALLLDIGGTTTDIAVFVGDVPVLEREGMQLIVQGQQRKTHVRALANLSLPIGGDSVLTVDGDNVRVEPLREGTAVAFGGEKPTLLDALLVLYDDANFQCHIEASARQRSMSFMTTLASAHHMTAQAVAHKAVDNACARIYEGIVTLLQRLNGQPVYTLVQLLEHHVIRPRHLFLVGAPAYIFRTALAKTLTQNMHIHVSVPKHAAVMNGLGAALTAPTAHLELFVDTIQQIQHTSPATPQDSHRNNPHPVPTPTLPASLDAACEYAVAALQERLGRSDATIDIVEGQCFSILDNHGHSGKDMRVRCQVRPHIAMPV